MATPHSRSPHRVTDFRTPADEFLAHACLTYGGDSPDRREHARALLAASPDLASASLHTAAALALPDVVRSFLDEDPSAARAEGGPFGWEPLLYLTYSRVGEGDPVATARFLLAAGADPNAGFLWEGNTPPFTALTGVFGEGEDAANQPRHRAEQPLAELLLEAGADPNDGQTLYNRMFNPDNTHLVTLFAHGLGSDAPTPWRSRCGDSLHTPARMLHDLLLFAAADNLPDRVRLLLSHGVPPAADLPGHPAHRGRTATELALLSGNPEIADLLIAAGAPAPTLDPPDACLATLMAGTPTPALPETLTRHPDALPRAAELDKPDAVRALAATGFPLEQGNPLHRAAFSGSADAVEALLSLGADPTARDPHFHTTPATWAAHHHTLAARLREAEESRAQD